GTQAATVHLLQRHQVVVGQQLADALQVHAAPRVGQQVLPAAGEVVVVALGGDAHLDIEAEQTQPAVDGQSGGPAATRVDARLPLRGSPDDTTSDHSGRAPAVFRDWPAR